MSTDSMFHWRRLGSVLRSDCRQRHRQCLESGPRFSLQCWWWCKHQCGDVLLFQWREQSHVNTSACSSGSTSKGDLQEELSYLTSLQFDQDLQQVKLTQSVQLIQAAIKGYLLAWPGDHCELQCVYLHYHKSSSKGYGGRQKLPDNLKQLFRPVAMIVPDNELIAKVMMFAEGFLSAKIMGQRIIAFFFLLSRQLLSMQQHYEWRLCLLKPILSLAGRLLQDHKRNHDKPPNDVEEAILLIKTVGINTKSKLTFADARRFQDLCVDLFPGVTVKGIEYAQLEIHIRETKEEMLHFHEACNQRMGVGVVGPSGCGKSTIWKVLKNAYKKQHKKYVVHIMNPKSMAKVRLLGHMDHGTRECFDGVLTPSARKN